MYTDPVRPPKGAGEEGGEEGGVEPGQGGGMGEVQDTNR